MQPKTFTIAPAEKVISILSYFTMGIAGLIWILIAYFLNKRLKFFLMYNAVQSMVISIFLALLNLVFNIIFQIMALIPGFNKIAINITIFLQHRINIFSLSFNLVETVVFLLLFYISAGVLAGRIFYVPVLTTVMKKVMHSYR